MLLDKIAFPVLEIQYFLWKLDKGSNNTMQSKACSPAVKILSTLSMLLKNLHFLKGK